MDDAYLCGWRVRSELPLPELARWQGDDREPDLWIRMGIVPDRLEGGVEINPVLQVDPGGAFLLVLPDVATFYVASPSEVVVAPAADAGEVEIRLFLLGSVLGFLCHLRGLFPLHASCVAIAGRAVAFSGASGAGKSTTALHMVRRGHALLADDVTVIDTAGVPLVWPAFPRLKLWQDSLASLGIDPRGLERNRPGQSKFHYRLAEGFHAAPVPLAAIIFLQRCGPGREPGMTRLTAPLQIVAALDVEVFRGKAARILGLKQQLLVAEAAIAGAVPVYRLTRPFDLDRPDDWLAQVEEAVRG